ncbi:MAG: pyridoxal phosphate-dependent aminotransferase [Thermoleophilia bacterium]|nr:pyridoxal phosphate-dependent aminotransferase [Thermoleophilia bacterium]
MQAVQTPIVPRVAALIRKHPGTISLGQGVVHYGPPQEAIDRIETFLADPENHKYKAVHGIPPLIEALTAKVRSENGISVGPPSAIVVTAGANMGFVNALLAVTDLGDEIILQTPYYFNHEMAVTMAGCRPISVDTDDRYQLRPDAIRRAITPRTRAVVTISPNNPSGAVYGEAALREVSEICRRHGLYHVSDEAYEYFTYGDARHFSPGSIEGSAGHTISLFSLSKAYGFASWRIGYMVIPTHLFESVEKIQDTLLICAPVISQYAAVGALQVGREYCRSKLASIAAIRERVLEELDAIRDLCDVPAAEGAFYLLLRVDTALSAMDLVERLVRDFGVAVIPGTTFGLNEGCHLRVSYGALTEETVAEGVRRLVKGLGSILRPSGTISV